MGYDTELAKGYFSVENRGRISILLENLMMKMTEIYSMPQWFDELKSYIEKNRLSETDQREQAAVNRKMGG